MRMRFKPYAHGELAESGFYFEDATQNCGSWSLAFKNTGRPIHLELGCGKGGFLAELAAQNADINYIGVDITEKVLVVAKRKIEQAFSAKSREIDNICLCRFDIECISKVFGPKDTVERIYINFCNPWNKKSGYKKHRLTYTRQLQQYLLFLSPGKEIYFKCDDDNLFEDSVKYFNEAGMQITFISRDLHAMEPDFNIRTEHEQMFSEKGIKIKALIAKSMCNSNV